MMKSNWTKSVLNSLIHVLAWFLAWAVISFAFNDNPSRYIYATLFAWGCALCVGYIREIGLSSLLPLFVINVLGMAISYTYTLGWFLGRHNALTLSDIGLDGFVFATVGTFVIFSSPILINSVVRYVISLFMGQRDTVKQLHAKWFKLLIVLITVIFIAVLVEFVCNQCSQGNLPWHLDYNYSHYLTVKENEYASTPGFEITDTVDGLRIYKVRSKRYEWYGLKNLFKKELVFETKDRRYIREFVSAAQKRMVVGDWEDSVMDTEEASEGCGWPYYKERDFDRFYVVMFDNTFMRAGYFLTVACKSRDKEYMNILVADTSGFGPISYYNESLIPIFKAIHP